MNLREQRKWRQWANRYRKKMIAAGIPVKLADSWSAAEMHARMRLSSAVGIKAAMLIPIVFQDGQPVFFIEGEKIPAASAGELSEMGAKRVSTIG